MTPSAFAQGRQTATRRCQNQDSDKTFTEALAEYYTVNSGKVFDTTLADEAMVDTRTLLSCDVAVRNSAHCLTVNPEAKALFKEAGYLK
jgi:hypothetical protein